ncbi:MAG: hypothetical protein JW757_11705 [Anaerolineales bacterium]|nr:hypothetical protein [Anaerolineales bacterium]
MNRVKVIIKNAATAIPEFFFSDRMGAYFVRILVFVAVFIAIGISFFSIGQRLPWFRLERYLAVVLLALGVSVFGSARYLNDLYELDKVGEALEYFIYCTLAFPLQPTIKINRGKKAIKAGEVNLIDKMGGPGHVKVSPQNLVILEKLEGTSQVYGEGEYPITRYQFIQETFSLDDHYHEIDEIKALTMDGITVIVPRVRFRFKLREREPDWIKDRGNTASGESYVEAARKYATNRLVSETSYLTMAEMIQTIIEEAIKKYINRLPVDQILTPHDATLSSREALRKELHGPEVREQLKEIGARLLSVEFAVFKFDDQEIEDFWFNRWKKTKQGEIMVLEAEGKAYEYARQDAVRSISQAEMTKGIIDALEDLRIDDAEDLETLIQLRTAQILDAWSGLYSGEMTGGEEKKDPKKDSNRKDTKGKE